MKYRNVKTTTSDGLRMDSKREAKRWTELQLLAKAGEIADLARQVPLVLAPPVKLHGSTRSRPAVRLVVDFRYTQRGVTIYEDSKGMETPVSKLKRHLAKTVLGIDVMLS